MKLYYTFFILLFLVSACSTTPNTPEAIKYAEAQKITSTGAQFPDYELKTNNDKLISNNQFDQGYVFYMFWGTWCASCIDNIVAVRDMKKQGLLKNVQFISVSVDKERDKWTQFIYQYDMDDYMENVLIGKDREHILSNFLYKEGIWGDTKQLVYHYITPAYCLVKDGVIVDNHPRILPKDKKRFLAQFN